MANCGYGRFLRVFPSLARKELFLLSGSDSFLKKDVCLRLLKEWSKDTIDIENVQGSTTKLTNFEDLLFERSMIVDFRVFVISGFDKLKPPKSVPKIIESFSQNRTGSKIIAILSQDQVDRLSKDVEDLFDVNVVCEPINVESKEFPQYIQVVLDPLGKSVSEDGLNFLKAQFPDRFNQLRMELEKAAVFSGDEKVLDSKLLEKVILDYPSTEIFELVEALFLRDGRKSFGLVKDLLAKDIGVQLIIHLLAQRIHVLYGVMEARRRGENLKEYMIRRKVPLFHYDKIVSILRVTTLSSLKNGIRALVNAEFEKKVMHRDDSLILIGLTNQFIAAM